MTYRRDGRVVGVVGLNCSGEVLRQAELLLRDVPALRWQRVAADPATEREAV
jgi:hypothetical protein